MEPAVVHLLAGPEAARDQEGVHRRLVAEAVVGQDGEPGLGLDGTGGVGDQERVELGVEAAGHREHAVGGGEVDDLGVLEHVDAQPEAGATGAHRRPRAVIAAGSARREATSMARLNNRVASSGSRQLCAAAKSSQSHGGITASPL